jgi:DNA-binding CsgD family transcriptional regulator
MSEVALLERAPHVNGTAEQTAPTVRWEMLPPEAQAAVARLTGRQWEALCRRLRGESYARIAKSHGCTKQSVCDAESNALFKLAHLGGRLLPCSVIDFVRATREAPAVDNGEYIDGMRGRAREGKSALDKLADAFLAEAERGPLSEARRAWYDARARQLEAQQLAE